MTTTIDVLEPIRAWLDAHCAQAMWNKRIEHVGTIAAYVIGGRVVLVQCYERDGEAIGWDAYTIADPAENDVAKTLAALDRHIDAGV